MHSDDSKPPSPPEASKLNGHAHLNGKANGAPGPTNLAAIAHGGLASAGTEGAAGERDDGEDYEEDSSEAAGVGADTGADELQEPLTPPPPQVADLVAACVRFVAAKFGVMPDGTPETLSLIDAYVAEARKELAVNPSALVLVQSAVGAYLGEVIRSKFLGEWFAEGDHDGWRLDLTTVFLTFNPMGVAREAMLLEPATGWHAHLELEPEDRTELERRLALLGEVDEDEYYAVTTRFEVIEIAVDVLRSQMLARGLGDVRFGADDYRRV